MLVTLLPWASPAGAHSIHIYTTGTPGPSGQSGGYFIAESQFLGFRFFVPAPVTSGTIGGHFAGITVPDIFGAIVTLTSTGDYPDSLDLSASDVLGAARIRLPPEGSGSRVIAASLSVSLSAGSTRGRRV